MVSRHKQNNFSNFAELKKSFNSVDKVGAFYVFDIGGNKLRLIAAIHFQRQKFYVRHVLAHYDYDKDYWKLKGRTYESATSRSH